MGEIIIFVDRQTLTEEEQKRESTKMMEKTKEYRKELAELFVNLLVEKKLDWKKEWSGSQMNPQNAKSLANYKGINRFRLQLVSMHRGYTDPRWATFLQVQDMGYHLKDAKGQGVMVEYWFPYDVKEKHAISWEQFYEAAQGKPDERFMLRASYSTVFNGSLIEGLPELPQPEVRQISIDSIVGTISKNMDVEILNDGGDRAYYRPSEDKIHLPQPEFFYTDYAYNSTALHELAHATGAPNRLNRNLGGSFGSEAYAYEELVAEMSSCFVSGDLQMAQDEHHIENHKAYVQSWIQKIKEKPETLVQAIADAERVAAYMDFKAELITEKDFDAVEHSTVEMEMKNRKPVQKKSISMIGPKL